ncbi:hypothetical protein BH11BAC3_BH11BAC3_07460 [soil metagenome]
MTPNEFVEKLKEQKEKAHNLLHESEDYDIRRGMGHSISGFVEDLFATYIASNLKRTDLIYFVDKVTSFKHAGMAKAKSIKPDLLILDNKDPNNKEKTATHYYDLKTDIGYGREMEKNLNRWNDLILSLRGNRAWITIGKNREYEIEFTNTIKYSVVVAIDWNVNKNVLKKNLEIAEQLEGIDMYVLINKEPESNFQINKNDFDKLMADCKRNL